MNKNHLIITLTICLLATMIVGSMIISAKSDQVKGLSSTNSMLLADLEVRKNKEGKILFEVQAARLTVQQLKKQLPEMAAQIARDFAVKPKDIRGYIRTEFEARGEGNASITRIPFSGNTLSDSSSFIFNYGSRNLSLSYMTRPDRSMYYLDDGDTVEVTIDGANQIQPFALIAQDGYLDFQAEVYNELDAPYTYTYGDTAKMAFIQKGKWFQRKTLYGSTMFSNPNAKVVNSQSVLINECRDRRWGIGPYVGYGLTSDGKLNISIGISIHRSLIKF